MPRCIVPIAMLPWAVALVAACAHASAVLRWTAAHPQAYADVRVAAVPGDGAVFAATQPGTGIVIDRHGPEGALRWERFVTVPGGEAELRGLAVDGAGDAIVLGRTGARADYHVIVGKVRGDGTIAWTRVLPRAPVCPGQFDDMALGVDAQRRPVVAFGDSCTQVVVQLSPDGDTLWTRRHASGRGEHGLVGDVPTDLAIDGSDGIVVAGVTGNGSGPYQAVAYTAAGGLRWVREQPTLIGTMLGPALVTIGPGDRPVLAASPETFCGLPRVMTWGYDADGTPGGSRLFGGCENAASRAVAVDAAGDVVVGVDHDFGWSTVVWAPDLTPLWDARLTGPDGARFGDALVMDDQRVIATGSRGMPGNTEVLTTVAYAPGGAVEWEAAFGAPALPSFGSMLASDGDLVYVAGTRGGQDGVVLCYRSSATAAAPFAPAAAAGRAIPNPFRTATRIALGAARGGDMRLEVFDGAGRRVRRLTGAPHAGGAVDWDGRDDAGHDVAPGVYLARIVAGGRVVSAVRVLRLE